MTLSKSKGVSHLYLCVLYYSKDERSFTATDAALAYEAWLNPL